MDNNIAFDLVFGGDGSKCGEHLIIKHAKKIPRGIKGISGDRGTEIRDCDRVLNIGRRTGIQHNQPRRIDNPDRGVQEGADCLNLAPDGFQGDFIVV